MGIEADLSHTELDAFHQDIADFLDAPRHVTRLRPSHDYMLLVDDKIAPADYARRLVQRVRRDHRPLNAEQVARKRELERELRHTEAYLGLRSLARAVHRQARALAIMTFVLLLVTVGVVAHQRGLLVDRAGGAMTPAAGLARGIQPESGPTLPGASKSREAMVVSSTALRRARGSRGRPEAHRPTAHRSTHAAPRVSPVPRTASTNAVSATPSVERVSAPTGDGVGSEGASATADVPSTADDPSATADPDGYEEDQAVPDADVPNAAGVDNGGTMAASTSETGGFVGR